MRICLTLRGAKSLTGENNKSIRLYNRCAVLPWTRSLSNR